MTTIRTFNGVMNAPEPTPNRMPPAEGGGINALGIWRAAIGGDAPQFSDVIDRKAAADSWFSQFGKMTAQPVSIHDDLSPEGRRASAASIAAQEAAADMDPKITAGKA